MRYIYLLLVAFIVSSCSLPRAQFSEHQFDRLDEKSAMYSFRIESWGQLKYSGLLMIRIHEFGIRYIVLDPTGIKLLESDTSFTKNYSPGVAQGVLQDSSLQGHLDRAMNRMFFSEPKQIPCSWNGLYQLCRKEQDAHRWLKISRFWPISLWKVEKSEGESLITGKFKYSQPWLGLVTIFQSNEQIR